MQVNAESVSAIQSTARIVDVKSDEPFRARPGLDGVIVGATAISHTIVNEKRLIYRGYSVDELAQHCSFEETVYLLWNGALPTAGELRSFCEEERAQRQLSAQLVSTLAMSPRRAHPMDSLRTGVSFLAEEDDRASRNEASESARKAMSLLAKIPTLIAYGYRLRNGLRLVPPDPSLGMAANFYRMCFDKLPHADVARALDGSLTLYAEHGYNASTFSARVVVSSLSDMYAGVVAGIGSLKGPLHGGANEQVMRMFKEIGSPDRARAWVLNALAQKRKIMGFGHRLYRYGDSRVPTMSAFRDQLAAVTEDTTWIDIARILEDTMLAEKNIFPNLDFPASPTYYMMGFEIDLFTPIFVIARISGWAAHIMEQLADNRLVRPLCEYVGASARDVIPLADRNESIEAAG
jgi:2-methylcitrate synthase